MLKAGLQSRLVLVIGSRFNLFGQFLTNASTTPPVPTGFRLLRRTLRKLSAVMPLGRN
jgi:hypothetical protein